MPRERRRPSPEELLARIRAEEESKKGQLRIWLGMGPGSGKTYAMLQEGLRRKSRGTDVVIGLVVPDIRSEIEDLVQHFEVVPPREELHDGNVLTEMDTDAVIARHPAVVLVDDLAHTYTPRSGHEKRYEDVLELIDAGINVVTTLDVQHIASLSKYVTRLTGMQVPETVPDWVVDRAGQIELLDLPPETLIRRMKEGKILPPAEAKRALETTFTAENLTVLRDLALRATAREVEEKLDTYLGQSRVDGVAIGERIMVAVDHRPVGKELVRRGWRLAAAVKGELIVIHVDPTEARRKPSTTREEGQLQDTLHLAEDLGATVVRLKGRVADRLVAYANDRHVSQIFIGHPSHGRWDELLHGSVTRDLLDKVTGAQVHVIAEPGRKDGRS